MNALDLMARLGGEILMNKVRAVINGEIVIVACLDEENEWVYTEAGQQLANEHSNLAVGEAATPTTKTRKKEAVVVESVEPQDEIAIEIEPTPEQ